MKTIFSFLGLLLAFQLTSQNLCGTDHQHEILLNSNENRAHFSWMNETILEKIIERRASGGEQELQVIPTVVHVIHNNGDENISLEQVEQGIDWLNEAMANEGLSFNPDGINIPIRFCLAKKDPDGEFTEGVNFVQNPLTDMLVPSQNQALKDVSRWDTEQYFNIWIVNSIVREDDSPGVVGYATFPDSHGSSDDGIVVEADYFGSNHNANNVVIHEVGHYLGLFHTFQGGCPNDDCLTSGDRVCDTAPDNNLFNVICFDGTNSCNTDEDDTSENNPFRPEELGGLGDQFDPQTNYMDYSSINCFTIFTAGQSERMTAALDIRASLFNDDKCTPPCENSILASASASEDIINVGESITFTNSSSNYTELQWYLDGAPVSEEEIYTFSPTEQGAYLIQLELQNQDPGCYQWLDFPVQVVCPINVEITPNSTSISAGGTVSFSVTVTGANSYEWYVDNVLEGTMEDFTFTFNDVGISSVYLNATNEFCTVQSQVWNISVGECTSGNEHNIWHWFNEQGIGYGLDFNEQPVNLLEEDPMLSIGHCKATICDDAGNLLFVSTGFGVYDRNYDLVENGSGLLGNLSSHYGTMFLKAPGNEDQYYLFTSSNEEENFSNGLRYSLIDSEANDGLGLVTEVKNEFIELTGTEHLNIVKHCNLRDKWLIFYDIPEGSLKSYLISENGIANTAAESNLNLDLEGNAFSQPVKPSPQGNWIFFDSFLMRFNQATGMVDEVIDLSSEYTENHISLAYDFSPNGKVLYVLTGDLNIELRQYDLTRPTELIPFPTGIEEGTFTMFAKDIQKGKDNIIYMEETITGGLGLINQPNLLGQEAMDYEPTQIFANAFINSFGNFYHAYIAGQDLLIDGDEIICKGTEHEFSVFGSECLDGDIDWEFSGDGTFTVTENQTVLASFPDLGEAQLIAKTASDCGEITDTLHISIIEAPAFDLGPDIGYCSSAPAVTLNIPSGYDIYTWSTGSLEPSITLESPSEQTITATGYYEGCYISDDITILGELSENINLGPDTDLCDGDVIILDAGPGYTDYLWQDGSTEQTFTAFLGGNYSVSTSMPCVAMDEIFIDECDQTINSINEEIILNSLAIYPNPANEHITVHMESKLSTSLEFSIYSALGELVSKETNIITAGSAYEDLNTLHLAEGSYYLTISGDNLNWTQEFIVIH